MPVQPAAPKRLHVAHIATQAIPFVKSDIRQGLSEVAGKVPAALASLGVNVHLVVPLFKRTQEVLQENGYQLEHRTTLLIRLGEKVREAHIKNMNYPLSPHY